MKTKSIMFGTLVLLLAVPAVSAANEVYLNPQTVYIPACGNATVQVLLNATDRVDTWSTMIEFDNESVNITEVDFTGGITPTNASWGYHGDYVYLGGVSLKNKTGDGLVLANLTVECNGSCGEVSLSVMGEENVERLIAGPPDGEPPHGTIRDANWTDGNAQCVACGDVNCDEDITPADAGEAFNRYLNMNYPLKLSWAADVNDDGSVTPADAGEIFDHYLNPSNVLNCHCEENEE